MLVEKEGALDGKKSFDDASWKGDDLGVGKGSSNRREIVNGVVVGGLSGYMALTEGRRRGAIAGKVQ